MLIINSTIFLFAISISALVIPSFLPLTTFLGILLLFAGMLLSIYRLGYVDIKNKIEFFENINYSNIFYPVCCILFLFFLFWARLYIESTNFISSFSNLVLHVLFFVFIINTRDYLLIYIKSYIYFVLLMSVAGLSANFLVTFGLFDPYMNFVNISEITDGAFSRDIGVENSYVFPYNLGFILTGSGKLNLVGFEFFRISGWAHEPTSATIFIAPAMILLLHTRIIANKTVRFFTFAVITLFWFFAMSLGSLLAFIILYFFYITVTLFIKYFPLKMSLAIVASTFIIILAGSYYLEELLNSSLLYSKLHLGSQTFKTAIDSLTWFMPSKVDNQAKSFSLLFIYTIMTFFLINIFYSFAKKKYICAYALVLLYIVIHTMKGSQESVYTHIFTFFWFYVLYFSIPIKVRSV